MYNRLTVLGKGSPITRNYKELYSLQSLLLTVNRALRSRSRCRSLECAVLGQLGKLVAPGRSMNSLVLVGKRPMTQGARRCPRKVFPFGVARSEGDQYIHLLVPPRIPPAYLNRGGTRSSQCTVARYLSPLLIFLLHGIPTHEVPIGSLHRLTQTSRYPKLVQCTRSRE